MPRRVDTYGLMARRMYDFGHSIEWKPEKNKVMRVIGVCEINVGNLPRDWRKSIRLSIDRGFSGSVNAPWSLLLETLSLRNHVAPQPIGYVGRVQMSAYFPHGAPIDKYREEMNLLWALENNTRSKPFRARVSPVYPDWMVLEAKLGYEKEYGKKMNPPPASFVRGKRLLIEYLADHRESRDKLLDWFDSKPVLQLPFASHNKKWEQRR